jgi:hypothetical protein
MYQQQMKEKVRDAGISERKLIVSGTAKNDNRYHPAWYICPACSRR